MKNEISFSCPCGRVFTINSTQKRVVETGDIIMTKDGNNIAGMVLCHTKDLPAKTPNARINSYLVLRFGFAENTYSFEFQKEFYHNIALRDSPDYAIIEKKVDDRVNHQSPQALITEFLKLNPPNESAESLSRKRHRGESVSDETDDSDDDDKKKKHKKNKKNKEKN